MNPRRSLAVARYAFMTNARAPLTRVGVAVMAFIAMLGPLISLKNHGVWAYDGDMLGTGFAVAAVFALRSGLAEHRTRGLEAYLRLNFVRPVEHMTGMVLALLATWAVLLMLALTLGLVVSAGDIGTVAWTAWMMILVTGFCLPFVLLVEAGSELRTPFFVPALVLFVAVMILSAALGPARAAELAGLVAERSDPATSAPLVARTAVAIGAGFPLILGTTWLRDRYRRR